ncbi:serine hydrolase, partial [candidate division KSB1 bacterium]|nr:serine hydrolase [candidate division KSB1 bacterium]
ALNAQYNSINGIVIVRNGYIVFERYNHGYGPDDTHSVASATKSFTSALTGIAIDAGFIKDVNQKVLDFFPEYISGAGDITKRIITIKHLLTMTAPFGWKTGARGYEPLDRLRRQRDWIKFILDLLGRNGPPGKFQYSSAASHLLSAIITRTTGNSAREFANEHLFGPIGMRQIPDHDMKFFLTDDVFGKNVTGWIKDPQGNSTGGWGLCITPRDMARFGFLYLNRGTWDGRQIISENWVEKSTAPNPNGYGYQWWLTETAFAASGYGGNFIFCVPGKDIVVAVASKLTARAQDRWVMLNRWILPAVGD